MTISVIIPCFDRFELTQQCLLSISKADPILEVVLVDNGSSDATACLDVAVRNDRNEGFASGCNQGAKAASGDILIFLNNDTIVRPGWTKFAYQCEDPEVGCAGPKLLYPDGSIQHAGVGIDFTRPWGLEAFNILDDWTDEPSEVDGVTGACLAIRRELFLGFGGFDEGYWNGYEDVDLCLQSLAAGRSNVYDPRSTITHLESQSGQERWTAVSANIARLREKWSHGR